MADATEKTYTLTLDVPGVPKADDDVTKHALEVSNGQVNPSLVEIPGLGAFANGESHQVKLIDVLHCARMFVSPDADELALPEGIKLAGKTYIGKNDYEVPEGVDLNISGQGPAQADTSPPVETVRTPDVPDDRELAVDEGYDSWKLDELQAELKDRDLPTSGNKPELVKRLQDDDKEEGNV
jgi:hypothetical protein